MAACIGFTLLCSVAGHCSRADFFPSVADSRTGTGESWDIAPFEGVGCGVDAGDTLCCNNVNTSYDRSIPGCGCGADRIRMFAVGRIVFLDATANNSVLESNV